MHLLLAAALALSPAHAEEEGYRMNDLGGTIHLPKNFSSESWADWELKAKSSDGVLFHTWLTPYQVPISEAALTRWTADYADRLRAMQASDVRMRSTEVVAGHGASQGRVALDFRIQGGAAVAHVASITTLGQVIHIQVLSSKRNERKALAALEHVLGTIELDNGPAETREGELETAAGFAMTLPLGWRAPVAPELEAVREISAKVGEKALAAEECIAAILPPAAGEADLVFACKTHWYLPPVDEHSFAGVEAQVHERFFGRSDKPVPHAEQVQIGDRLGFYYRPPVAGGPVRLALAPYDGGVMTVWGLGGGLDEAGLDEAMMASLATVRFTGPDGGKPIISADKWVMHFLKYRTFSPMVLGPVLGLFALIGGLGMAIRRKGAAKYDDL